MVLNGIGISELYVLNELFAREKRELPELPITQFLFFNGVFSPQLIFTVVATSVQS